jgi:hypothetical protein
MSFQAQLSTTIPTQIVDKIVDAMILECYSVMANFSRSWPVIQRGGFPRPLQVAPDAGSRYLAATGPDCFRGPRPRCGARSSGFTSKSAICSKIHSIASPRSAFLSSSICFSSASRCASRARYPVFVISVVFSSMIGNVSSTNDVRSRSGKLVATG